MRGIVVDASIAVKWYRFEEHSEKALTLLADAGLTLLAPDLFFIEVASVLERHRRRGRLSDDLFVAALADLKHAAVQLFPSRDLVDEAVKLAGTVNHALYDCLYLALAEQEGVTLVTADLEFVGKFAKHTKDIGNCVVPLSEFAL